MSSRRGIACAGCWTLDRISLIDDWPAEEGLAHVIETERQGGGSAHNVGIDLTCLDPALPVEAYGLVGDDADGHFLVDAAREAGLDVGGLACIDGAVTAYTEVMTVRGTGRRTFFHRPGANDEVTPARLDVTVGNARIVHLGLLGLHATLDRPNADGRNGWSEVLERAQAAGLRTNIELVSIDPARNRELVAPCLPYLDYLIVNDQEIGALADRRTVGDGRTDADECRLAAREVLERGAMALVVVHWPGGAIACRRDGETVTRPANAVDAADIRSSVGAGDAFAAGMLYALHEHWSLDDALELAHAAAMMSLRVRAAVGGVESVAACLAQARALG